MSRGHEAIELMNDHLSDLPDDLLSDIICKLDLIDAVKTSILSKRWRYIWTNLVVDLKFNHFNILGLKSTPYKKQWEGLDTGFVKLVDKIMKQRSQGNRNKINSFCLQFPLGMSFSSSIDWWIDFVVANRVDTIDLDLSSELPLARYNFSLLRTVSNNEKMTLKHLRVTNCNFQGRSSSPKFGSLISLQLQSVNISSLQLAKVLERCPLLEELTLDTCCNLTKLTINATLLKHLSLTKCSNLSEIDVIRARNLISLHLKDMWISSLQLTNIIERCPLLEELTLHTCPQLEYLRILESSNSRLKRLDMDRCYKLKEIDLCANFLHTFEYNGMLQWFSFKKSPRLVNVFIGEDICLQYPSLITRIARDIPSLENLIIASYHSLKFFFANDPEPVFSLRRLVLNLVLYNEKDELLWVNYILKAFPLLETLELNFKKISWMYLKGKVTFEKCPHRFITKLEVNGFHGNHKEIDLLKFLLENLSGLRVLAIGPCCKIYTSFNGWVKGGENIKGEKWFKCNSELLRTIIPPLVHLEFL